MQHKPEKLLKDIVDAGNAIKAFTKTSNLESYSDDLFLRSAVERQFEIIGEALNRLGRIDASLLATIEHNQEIISFRNIIAHGYDVIDCAIVWQIINDYLPELLSRVHKILDQISK